MMHKPLRLMAALLALCVLAAAFPTVGLAAEGIDPRAGSNLADMIDAASSGATITLTSDTDVTANIQSDPWIIDKEITINGNGHSIRVLSTGILLGANVTFRDVNIDLVSTDSRNAIIANGYTLTLDNVKATNLAANIFCGTLLKADHETFQVPTPGTTNTLNILGKTDLQGPTTASLGTANIFAGSLAMGGLNENQNGPDDNGPENIFPGNVTINISDSGNSGALGIIYAGGGQQRIPVNANSTKVTVPDPEKYRVGGTVTITGTNAIPNVNGAGSNATHVVYRGGDYPATKTFTDISSLSVETGSLALDNASWSRDDGTLSLASGAQLDLKAFSGTTLDGISRFDSSGGFLFLRQDQTWNMNGQVSGTAKIVIGSLSADKKNSMTLPVVGHTYIQAPNSSAGNFQLLPYSSQPNMTLERDASGNWTAVQPAGEVSKLVSLRPEDIQAKSGDTEVIIPLHPGYTGTELGLNTLPLAIQVNGAQAAFIEDPDPDASYYEAGGLRLYIGKYEGEESLAVYHVDGSYKTPISDDTYTIKITVPGAHTASGNDATASCTLTVGDSTPVPGEPTVTGISVSSTTHKTEYNVGDPLDVTDLTIDVAYSDNTMKTVSVTAEMVSGFDPRQAVESQVLTITYEGKTTTYTIKITALEEPGDPKYQVTLNDLGDGGSGAGAYEAGSLVIIRAGSRSGYTFSAWQHPYTVTLADRNSPETSFVMPSTDVALQAVWEPEGGTAPPTSDHIHAWNAAWSSNQTHHWHDCTTSGCTVTDDSQKDGYATHTAGAWVVDRPAGPSQNGTRHRSCTVCSYMMEQEVIPATGGGSSSGNGPSSEGGSASGRPSSGGSGTTTVKKPDAPATTTNTDPITGTVTETTRRPDGSETVVETQKDGTVTTTDTAKDGSTVKVVERPNGTAEAIIKQSDGLTASVLKDQNGATADIRLPSKVASEGPVGSVVLPIPALPGENASVTIHTGTDRPVPVEIPVSGNDATTVACLVNSDGSETILKTALLTGGQITVSISDGATVHIRDNSKAFLDTGEHWARNDIDFVAARELFSGETSSTFAPDASMSRAMLMTVLARLDGVDATGSAAYEQGMAWAVAKGISDGRDPDGQVTREQFVSMLYRYAGSPAATDRELHFSDVDEVSAYAMDAIRWALENGILNGYEDGSFAPQGKATRAQAAAMLSRYVRFLDQQ